MFSDSLLVSVGGGGRGAVSSSPRVLQSTPAAVGSTRRVLQSTPAAVGSTLPGGRGQRRGRVGHRPLDLRAGRGAAAPLLEAEVFSASSTRDALGRTLAAVSPDGSEVTYGYDEGGLLTRVDLRHRGGPTLDTLVGDIAYDAKGQRQSITHGPIDAPTSTTAYTYDPHTFRLQRLTTTRTSDQALLQSLHYHYDPAGNLTDVRDAAQQTLYFQNTVVEAANTYTYDALYRLIEATGREHASDGTTQRSHDQLPVGPQPMTSDPSAMRRYTQRFTYDVVGNILALQHIPSTGTGWTRRYQYAEDGNRLLASSAPGDAQNVYTHAYTHDAHGSMTTMPHLAAMLWNHDDQLEQATAGTTTVHFQYAGSSRARKYTQHAGATTEERIYLGPFELYRKRVNGDLDLERESLHVSDGTGRICLIETKTISDGAAIQDPLPIWRYQLGNHLGSAAIELTRAGQVISYEEYHPYGTSAYRAVDAAIDVSPKRYRYTGMERDEETGLAYHTARYYAPWLGRWTAADPIGLADGLNQYTYTKNKPTITTDLNGNKGWLSNTIDSFPTPSSPTPELYPSYIIPQSPQTTEAEEETEHSETATSQTEDNPTPRKKTDAEYEAEVYRELEHQLEVEDADHYNRPLIAEFLPLIGLVDLPHDAGQLGAAIELGDEQRARNALTQVSLDVIFTVLDIYTFGGDRLIAGSAKKLARKEAQALTLSAKGANGEARHEAKAAVRSDAPKGRGSLPEQDSLGFRAEAVEARANDNSTESSGRVAKPCMVNLAIESEIPSRRVAAIKSAARHRIPYICDRHDICRRV
nr:RHS repeat-associated core domain-containing protein [Pseudenhygromyxa sp. WMMC2535]